MSWLLCIVVYPSTFKVSINTNTFIGSKWISIKCITTRSYKMFTRINLIAWTQQNKISTIRYIIICLLYYVSLNDLIWYNEEFFYESWVSKYEYKWCKHFGRYVSTWCEWSTHNGNKWNYRYVIFCICCLLIELKLLVFMVMIIIFFI